MNARPDFTKFEPFHYKSLADLKKKIKELNLEIPISPELEILQSRIQLYEDYIPNRLAIQPMEGFDATENGSPTELTKRRYDRYAHSGVGLIWFEATAIIPEGRSNPHQLVLTEENLNKFKKLVSDTRLKCNSTLSEMGFKNDCILVLQLNHSGRYSQKDGKPFPIRAFKYPPLDQAKGVSKRQGKIISDEELEDIEEIWYKKIILAKEAGFDGADIKTCHGYLLNDLLSARTRVDSKYGGKSLKNRSRLLINLVKKSMDTLAKDSEFFITTRTSIYNGIPFPYGFGIKEEEDESFPAPFNLNEPKKLITQLYELGIRLVNVSAGDPHYSPHLTRPFDRPTKGSDIPREHPLLSLNRIYHLTKLIKSDLPEDLIILGSAYSYGRQYAGHIAAGMVLKDYVDMCGFGRMAFANPEFAKQILQQGGIDKKKTCISCSKCSQLMREGKSTGCVIRDPQYR